MSGGLPPGGRDARGAEHSASGGRWAGQVAGAGSQQSGVDQRGLHQRLAGGRQRRDRQPHVRPAAAQAPLIADLDDHLIAITTGFAGADVLLFGTTGEGPSLSAAEPLRRITHSQFNNAVRDLLGDQTRPADSFPPEDFVHGFKNQFQAQSISPLLAEAYGTAAEKLARAISGELIWDEALFSYHFSDPDGALNTTDSAPYAPRGVVINPFFDWGVDRPPQREYADSIIYEAHVKGLTETHPEIPEQLRGTYAGIAHPVIIEHLRSMGITAIELMPVHHFANDSTLMDKGLSNYWGYNTMGFFAPDAKYTSSATPGGQVQEFKAMVRALHEAGIEVILDVVYNHTAEGNHLGPTLSMRGIDNPAYYRLVDDDKRYYMDYTGTGNSLNVGNPHSLQLIMDSLRYWVTEMHVDGFRFDLAATLAREFYDVDRLSAFFELVQQDPTVSQVKLIAEPWDVGEGGYQVGNFPGLWTEWNGKYRDTVRDYWRGEPATLGEFASRLTGSSDLYEATGRRPSASINFVTCHDGFTLTDLVSYNEKHNEANGEDNRDGESHNRSWNCGVEGPTDDPEIIALREDRKSVV